MLKLINKLIWIKRTQYDDGHEEVNFGAHPVVYIVVFVGLIIGGYYAF